MRSVDRLTRWLWAGWALSALFGFLAPFRRAALGVSGSGTLPVLAAIGLMLAVMLIVRKRPQSFYSALLMNAAGLTVGAATAFGTLGLIFHRTLYELIALKWIVLGGILTFAFVRQIKQAVAPKPEFNLPNLEGLSREEAVAAMRESMGQILDESRRLRARSNRLLLTGAIFLVVGGAVLTMGGKTDRLSPTQRSFLYAGAGTALLIASAGVLRSQAGRPSKV